MTQNLPGPYTAVFEYHSSGGPHTMTRPINDWSGIPFETEGVIEAHDGSDVDPSTVFGAFVDLMLPLFADDTTFDLVTIYYRPTEDDPSLPVWSQVFTGKVGTANPTVQHLTYQKIFTFRTALGGLARLNLEDAPTGGTISNTKSVTGAEAALVAHFMSAANPWCGRDGSRPVVFRSLSNGVNDALKNAYRM